MEGPDQLLGYHHICTDIIKARKRQCSPVGPAGVQEMTRKDHLQGTDNVLVDLGFEDAEELSAKAALAVKLNELIDRRGLSQTAAAHITGMTQPKISQVKRYKLQNISLERLMQALVSLDQQVAIVVRPARRSRAAGITVTA
jgi:predicted XRE-type DNA-binding protein